MFVPSARQSRTASRGFSDRQANQAVSSVYNFTKEKIQGRELFDEEYSLPCETLAVLSWCSDYGAAGGTSLYASLENPHDMLLMPGLYSSRHSSLHGKQ